MPFTHEQFLDLFGLYNVQLGPVVGALWLVTVLAVLRYLRRELTMRAAAVLLAVHWGWSGAVYHAAYFTRINPVAWLFAAAFVAEAGGFAWLARDRQRPVTIPREPGSIRGPIAEVFLVAAVVYPLLALMTGHALPRAPLFAVPCPTTLLTAGLLLALGRQAPRGLLVVPILWSVVGGSAALTLGVLPDYLLIGAAVALATVGFLPSHRRQAAAQAG